MTNLRLVVKKEVKTKFFAYLSFVHPQVLYAREYVMDAIGIISEGEYEDVPMEELHMTMLMADNVTDVEMEKFVDLLVEELESSNSVPVRFERIGTFEEAEQKPVVMHAQKSGRLVELQKLLASTLEKAKPDVEIYPYTTPELWSPHVTLFYLGESVYNPPSFPWNVAVAASTLVISREDFDEVARFAA